MPMTAQCSMLRAVIALAAATAHVGCASIVGGPSGVHGPPQDVGRVALVVDASHISLDVTDVPLSKGAAARSAAGGFFINCQPRGGGGGGGDPSLIGALLIWEVVCITGAGVSAIVGASRAPGAATMQSMVESGGRVVASARFEEALSAEIHRAAERVAPGRLFHAASDQDSAAAGVLAERELRVALTGMALKPDRQRRSFYYLVIQLDVAVVDLMRDEILKSNRFWFQSEARTVEDWVADDGRYLTEAISRASPRLGEGVADYTFLLYRFPHQGVAHGWTWFTGLVAEAPPHKAGMFKPLDPPRVDSLRPSFRWQAFPRDVDLVADPEAMGRVEHVRYDLLISEVYEGTAGDVVYRRDELPSNEHTIEIELAPSQGYFWTVRARFQLDGREFVTEWAQRAGLGFLAPTAANYSFLTP
jgi:hypothetical protein